jgi:hypothetical protein
VGIGAYRKSAAWLLPASFVLSAALMFPGPALAASCAAQHSTTVLHKNDLRIYRQNHAVWVCSTLYGRRIRLAQNAGPGMYDVVPPPGPHKFAYGLFRRPSTRTFAYAIADDSFRGVFGSRDLKTGALLRGHVVDTGGAQLLRAEQLVARPNGSIAYIYEADAPASIEDSWAIEKVDRAGFQGLDGSCELCANSVSETFLAISGPNLEWMDNSITRSVPFQ